MVPTPEEYGIHPMYPDEYGSIYPEKIMVLPLKNFMKILNLHPQTIPYIVFFFLTLSLKKFLGFCYLPLKNSICFQQGAEGMDIKITIMPNDSTVMINSTLEIDLRLDY